MLGRIRYCLLCDPREDKIEDRVRTTMLTTGSNFHLPKMTRECVRASDE